MKSKISIIALIDEIRIEQGLSWQELSRRSGVHHNTVRNWMRPWKKIKDPGFFKLEATFEALGYEFELVLKESERK